MKWKLLRAAKALAIGKAMTIAEAIGYIAPNKKKKTENIARLMSHPSHEQ